MRDEGRKSDEIAARIQEGWVKSKFNQGGDSEEDSELVLVHTLKQRSESRMEVQRR